jgi:ABC-type glycerol-3-phosphate transport system substrate-binding protein
MASVAAANAGLNGGPQRLVGTAGTNAQAEAWHIVADPTATGGTFKQDTQGRHCEFGPAVSRRGVLLTGVGTVPAVLAACTRSPAGGSPTPRAKPVTLTYLTDWSGGTRADWVKTALPKFTEENPGITIQAEASQGDVKAAAIANAAAGTLSDLLMAGGDVPHHLVKAGVLHDITPLLKTLKVKMDDVVWIPSTIQVKGKQYGMPFQWNYWTLAINKALFKQAGADLPNEKTTYPQLVDALRRVARPDDSVYGIDTLNSIWYWFPYIWAWGGEAITPDARKTLVDQPAALEALQFYTDLMLRQRVGTPLTEKGQGPAGVSFVNGNLAIGNVNAPGKGIDASVAGKFEWDVMWHPVGPKTGKRYLFVSEQPNVVTTLAASRGQAEQATRFAVWACASKTAQELMIDIGTNSWPTSKAVLQSQKYLAGPPASVKVLVDQISSFKDPLIFQGWIEWRTELSNALTLAFTGARSVPEAAREAVRAGDLVLAKYAG